MTAPLLLDTCAAIWLTHSGKLGAEAVNAVAQALDARDPLYISPITAWEVGLQIARGRMTVAMPPRQWFRRLVAEGGVTVAGMPPDILMDSSELPGHPPADPADRIIIATAREYGLRVVTRDRKILDYADKGYVMAMAC